MVRDLSSPVAVLTAGTMAAAACWFLVRTAVLAVDHVSVRRVQARLSAFRPNLPASTARWWSRLALRLRAVAGRDAVGAEWPAWLDAAVRSARSGASLRDALVEAAHTQQDSAIGDRLRAFTLAVDRGAGVDHALDELDSGHDPAATVAVRALRLAVHTGGPATVVLDAAASTLHERVALAREVRALATQARTSAAVMVVAPIVFLLLAGGTDRRAIEFFASGPGVLCLLTGLALEGAGALWMARIVRAEP